MKNPGKDLSTVIVGGLSTVMEVYIIINLAYLRLASASELALVTSLATWLVAILACIYALSGQFNLLIDLTVFMVWVFYILTFIGVIKLRKDSPNLDRPYKVPLYPVIPLIAIIGGLFVIVNQLLTATLIALGDIIITLIGLPVYNYMSKKNDN